ncbi:MAG TPA: hypothetical protein DCQ58_11290 [Saprospirales bacterium]|nr:hypothetical protein [Saprospirales bacterium]
MNQLLTIILLITAHYAPVIGDITRVIDGDTIEMHADNGAYMTIRLHGIDSPDKCQNQFEEAKEYATKILLNKKVKFIQTGTDQYGRFVGEIYLDADNTRNEFGVWFNAAIVGSGFAWHWPRYSNSQQLASLQLMAKKLKVGVWQESNPIPPWEFRKSETYKNCKTHF